MHNSYALVISPVSSEDITLLCTAVLCLSYLVRSRRTCLVALTELGCWNLLKNYNSVLDFCVFGAKCTHALCR